MPLAFIRPMGESGLYHIHVVSATDPGFGGGRPQPGDPDYGRPEFGRPGHDLPWGPCHPGNRPPGSGGGGIPDHELPDHPPPTLAPGYTIVMVRSAQGRWEYAFIAPGDPPPKPLPPQGRPDRPDNSLPIQPGHPGNVVPGQPVIGGGPVEPRPP